MKSAYRRMHLYHMTAVKTVTQVPELNLALMSLCCTFRGVPDLYKWDVVSETICDLINESNSRDEWQPEHLFGKNLFLVPPPVFLDNSVPFEPGLELIVDFPVDSHGITDMCIHLVGSECGWDGQPCKM